jgi:hypothetical protein
MSARDDQPLSKQRLPLSGAQPPFSSESPPSPLSHVPRFALIHDLASGARTHAPVTYLFSDDPQPPLGPDENKVRTLIIDLTDDGERVEHAQSLSTEWQLISAKVGTLTRTINVDGGENFQSNAVLNIEGLAQFTPYMRSDDVFDLARQFSERYIRYEDRGCSLQERNDKTTHREVEGVNGPTINNLSVRVKRMWSSGRSLIYINTHLSRFNIIHASNISMSPTSFSLKVQQSAIWM